MYVGSDAGAWEKKLHEYLPLEDVTHKLDPWHLNRAIKVAWPDKCDHDPLFELLHKGKVDGLINVLELRKLSGYGDRKKFFRPEEGGVAGR